MNDFTFYFSLGWTHILHAEGLDHLLFILVLTCAYAPHEWKKLLILVTAFTIGHTLTLALSTTGVIQLSTGLAEFLIPCTIFCSSLINLVKKDHRKHYSLIYITTFLFGLIHGMGFANTIRFMVASNQSLFIPLAAFNLGLEAGQILFVLVILSLSILIKKMHLNFRWWTIIISSITLLLATWMVYDRWPMLHNNR